VSEPVEVPVSWYDGRSAIRHEGLLCWSAGRRLILRHPETEGIDIEADELIFREQRPGERVYALRGTPAFRLMLAGDAPSGIVALLPRPARYGRWIDRFGLPQAAIAFAVVSAAVVALAMTLPSWLGPMVPASWERRMGEAMVGDFGNRICHTPAGDAALAKLTAELDTGGEPIRVGVANVPVDNAVSLPGGQVLVFNGLVEDAKSPDELAAVLAHEIGHVRERHVMTALLRQFGLSILTAGAGSGIGQNVFGIASLGYSRRAEAEADDFARDRLRHARISPAGAADFFDRLRRSTDEEPGWAGWLQSHPASLDRERAFRDAVKKDGAYVPALSAREFGAIRTMCRDDKKVEDFDLF
jgi:Zn-dependent protease with chaperone function